MPKLVNDNPEIVRVSPAEKFVLTGITRTLPFPSYVSELLTLPEAVPPIVADVTVVSHRMSTVDVAMPIRKSFAAVILAVLLLSVIVIVSGLCGESAIVKTLLVAEEIPSGTDSEAQRAF